MELRSKRNPANAATASGSPQNAIRALKGKKRGGKKNNIEMGEDVVEYLTHALEVAEKKVTELEQENKRLLQK